MRLVGLPAVTAAALAVISALSAGVARAVDPPLPLLLPAPPRLLEVFTLQGVGTFELRDSDPRAQAEAFCAAHALSPADCAGLVSQAEEQFFSFQWLLESTVYTLTDSISGATGEATFNLYSGLGPVLQSHRFCEFNGLSTEACKPITEQATETFYLTGKLLFETQLELSYMQDTGDRQSVSFALFDNLPPAAQALDLCLLYGIGLEGCTSIVSMTEEAFYPLLTFVPLLEGVLELRERADPALTALAACSKYALSSSDCSSLVELAEITYFSALDGGAHVLQEKYSLPAIFARECYLYEGIDPYYQALRCCDLNGASFVSCKSVIETVRNMYFGSDPLVKFSLQRTLDDPSIFVEMSLYPSLNPVMQLMSFCREHAIDLASCLSYEEVTLSGYYEAEGRFLVSISLSKPVDTPLMLFSGSDPVQQAKWFCARHHITDAQCMGVVRHAINEYLRHGNEIVRIRLPEVAEDFVLFDNLDPEVQTRYYCQEHSLGRDLCYEMQNFAERQYFGAGEVIDTLSTTVRGTPVSLTLYQQFDPIRQVKSFCGFHRIARSDCTGIESYAKDLFQQAGNVVDIVRMYTPSGENGTMMEQQMDCFDNLDPEVQARRWCEEYAMAKDACKSLIDIFDATYYGAGERLSSFDFGGAPFTLLEDFDPFVQASRFCKRRGISLKLCEPLIVYSETIYYKYGQIINVYEMTLADGKEVSFTLFDKADPSLQAKRFCERNKMANCTELVDVSEKAFEKAGIVLQTLTVQNLTGIDDATTFELYSNLDPAVQVKRLCLSHNMSTENCVALTETAERIFFRAGEVIADLTYQLSDDQNVTLTMYNGVDPDLQITRFFKKHSIPRADRRYIKEAMTKKFFEVGNLLTSFNVSIDGELNPQELCIFDNLDPLIQVKSFCKGHSLIETTCEDLIAAAEAVYFDAEVTDHFSFTIEDKTTRFNYFRDLAISTQVDRFCRVHEFSTEWCDTLARLVQEQVREVTDEARPVSDGTIVPKDLPNNEIDQSDDIVIEL